MIRHIKNYFLLKKFRDYNFKKLNKIKNILGKDIVLVEFNSFNIIHIIFSYFSFFFLKKKYRIVSFYSHILMTYPLKQTTKQKVYRFLSPLLNLGFFGIYKSFGVNNFMFPKIDKNNEIKSIKKNNEIFNKLNSKEDVLKINLNNIFVGDLIYDTYLTRNGNQKPTIDIKSEDFKKYLLDFIKLFYFWYDYFENNKVKVILTTHGCYTMGIPVRIALKKDLLSLEVKENRLKRLTKKNFFYSCESEKYPEMFSRLSSKSKEEALRLADQRLKKRFEGSNEDIPYVTRSAFSKDISLVSEIDQNKKIKVLILPHDFIDAPHSGGFFPFPDMYEWLKFLAKISSEKTNYDWYIKTHPKMGDKWEWYQEFTRKNVSNLIKNSRIRMLHPNTSHNKIINSGINFVLTIFGTAAHEYAYKNVKVINGGDTNPHYSYDFNKHISNYRDYKKTIKNLDKLNFSINRNKVLEFYYIHYIYCDKNWFFDYEDMMRFLGNYHLQWSSKIYNYWLKYSNKSKNFDIYFEKSIEKFILSNDLVFTLDHKMKLYNNLFQDKI